MDCPQGLQIKDKNGTCITLKKRQLLDWEGLSEGSLSDVGTVAFKFCNLRYYYAD